MKWINSKTTPKATPAAVGRPKGTTVQKEREKGKNKIGKKYLQVSSTHFCTYNAFVFLTKFVLLKLYYDLYIFQKKFFPITVIINN
jgi:hypothetical protein